MEHKKSIQQKQIGTFLNGCSITLSHVQYQWNQFKKCKISHGS